MSVHLLDWLFAPVYQIPPEVEARFQDESLCRRCGRCCHSAVWLGGRFVLLKDLPCRHLAWNEDGTAFCRIYEQREETGFCHKLSRRSVERNLFPPDCPYVEGIPGYRGKVEVSAEEFQALVPALCAMFQDYPPPPAISSACWNHFLSEVLKRNGGPR